MVVFLNTPAGEDGTDGAGGGVKAWIGKRLLALLVGQ